MVPLDFDISISDESMVTIRYLPHCQRNVTHVFRGPQDIIPFTTSSSKVLLLNHLYPLRVLFYYDLGFVVIHLSGNLPESLVEEKGRRNDDSPTDGEVGK